jgi:uncharacterized protein (DUF697 family)/predicted GTPase
MDYDSSDLSGNLLSVIKKAQEETKAWIGTANILVAGKTGVGKSTLINGVFGKKLAATGTGEPITKHLEKYSIEGSGISIYDSKGLELADFIVILNELKEKIAEFNNNPDAGEHILLCWLCIDQNSARIEAAEQEFLKELAEQMPVIVVITKSYAENPEFIADAERLLQKSSAIIEVNSESHVIRGGHKIDVFGLDDLVKRSYELLPESQRRAFVRAQKISISKKSDEAKKVVNWASGLAAAACANPVPIPDAVFIVPIQIRMMMRIGAIFGLSTEGFENLLIALVGPLIAAGVGRQAFGMILKWIPGIGTIVGGVVSATVAASITQALGKAYIEVMIDLVTQYPAQDVTYSMVAERLKSFFGK